MRILKKKNTMVKSNPQEALKQNAEVSLEPQSMLRLRKKFKKTKNKAKMEESLKETLLEWLEKMVTSQTSGKFKSNGINVLKLIIDEIRKGGKLRKNSSHEDDGKDMDTKDEYIHE